MTRWVPAMRPVAVLALCACMPPALADPLDDRLAECNQTDRRIRQALVDQTYLATDEHLAEVQAAAARLPLMVAEARQMQNALAARGINSVRSNREAQWLAAQPD